MSFISNILITERLSREQARQVKSISDGDDEDDIPLTDSERQLLDTANGKVLFFLPFWAYGFSVFRRRYRVSTQASLIMKR